MKENGLYENAYHNLYGKHYLPNNRGIPSSFIKYIEYVINLFNNSSSLVFGTILWGWGTSINLVHRRSVTTKITYYRYVLEFIILRYISTNMYNEKEGKELLISIINKTIDKLCIQ